MYYLLLCCVFAIYTKTGFSLSLCFHVACSKSICKHSRKMTCTTYFGWHTTVKCCETHFGPARGHYRKSLFFRNCLLQMLKFKEFTRERKIQNWWKPNILIYPEYSRIGIQQLTIFFYLIIWWNIISPHFYKRKEKKML
jgi:hypothetical protein